MELFSVTSQAMAIIRSALAQSPLQDPVVYLIVAGAMMPVSPEESRALREGADDETLRALAMKELARQDGASVRRLEPFVYPRDNFPSAFLEQIQGVTFVVPPEVRLSARGGRLDAAERGLALFDEVGRRILPEGAEEKGSAGS